MLISVCMIVKNEEKTLPVCLSSLQGIVDEMIIVDNNSTDESIDIINEYADELNITLIQNEVKRPLFLPW